MRGWEPFLKEKKKKIFSSTKVFVFEGQKSGSCIIVASDRADIEPKGLPKEARKLGGRIGGIDLGVEIGKC